MNSLPRDHSPILAAASTGDERALSSLLTQARPMVLSWASKKTEDPDEAEDIAQCVLLRLLGHLSSFRGESSFSAWLYRITLNEVASHFRRERRARIRLGDWEPTPVERGSPMDRHTAGIDSDRLRAAVEEAVRELPPFQQIAVTMVDLEGFKPCEAAKALAKTQETVRSSLCRARKRVRDLVTESRHQLVRELTSAAPPTGLEYDTELTAAAGGAA